MLVLISILPIFSCITAQCLRPTVLCDQRKISPCAPSILIEPEYTALGCLQPTITPYGTLSEVPLFPLLANPEVTLSMLPAASPISALIHPFSCIYPPALPCNCGSHFLKKIPIPPPFI
ncbi:unnamed protein product [Pieris brassicae]|uniref:Uncharacterized protein n=1 Tax=Pieris brassicae TaxID=7116 RepID=A0A9P0TJ35_PIEBR|nr:unnamed protein product [Pieris brassicae]